MFEYLVVEYTLRFVILQIVSTGLDNYSCVVHTRTARYQEVEGCQRSALLFFVLG